MTLNELRVLATAQFGDQLQRATPQALSEFLAELQVRLPGTQSGGVIQLNGAPESYEQVMREYFADMLSAPAEVAAASLWITAAELWVDAMSSVET